MSPRHFAPDQPREYDNPWQLTPREVEALTACCDTGSQKGAAQRLQVSVKVIETHIRNARRKMGQRDNKLLAYLTWDRYHRGQQ